MSREWSKRLSREHAWAFNHHGDNELRELFATFGNYAAKLPCADWLTVSGDEGCGKTHLARKLRSFFNKHHIMRWVKTEKGDRCSVNRAVFRDWCRVLDQKLNRDKPDPIPELERCGLLVLDDIGAESGSASKREISRETLLGLMNYRDRNGLPIVITTNLDREALIEWDRRIFDRINRRGKWFRTEAGSYALRDDARAGEQHTASRERDTEQEITADQIKDPRIREMFLRLDKQMSV